MLIDLSCFERKKEVRLKDLPMIPDTGWQRPIEYPELRNAVVIGVDCETREFDFDHGPGWGRGLSHIVGVSIAAIWPGGHRRKWYFPIRHTVEAHDNLDPVVTLDWLKAMLTTNIPKVGANLLYDYGCFAAEGIWMAGELIDVQFAEALIDEEEYVALDILGRKYLGQGKTSDALKDWIIRAYNPNKSAWRGDIWRTPPRLTGFYAEDDADLPLDIFTKQRPILEQEGLVDLFKMECRSIPMYVKMRMQGITIDIPRAEKAASDIRLKIPELYKQLSHNVGITIDSVDSPAQLVAMFDRLGIVYPRTKENNPSFRKEWLKGLDHPLGAAINEIREHQKVLSTFFEGYILNRQRDNKIYCSFHPLKGDDNGAKTGRLSSSDPNLQNVSVRTELGRSVRECFVAHYGHKRWHKKDQSQIEYRLFGHFASGHRSDEIRARYRDDPSTDYHKDTMIAIAPALGKDLSKMTKDEIDTFRRPIKNINFGLLYGQNAISLAYKSGMTMQEAKTFVDIYHRERPFVKSTMEAIMSEVQAYGFITTLLGRRVRFRKWESLKFEDRGQAFEMDHAIEQYGGNIRRAYAYRAVNYRFQGSAADVMKKGMDDCYQSGVFDFVGMPLLQVHDELDWSEIDDSPQQQEAFRYITHTLENCVQLSIPLKVDSKSGANWGVIN